MSRPASFLRLLPIVAVTFSPLAFAQFSELDQIQIAPPMRQIQPPSQDASVKELERTGDELRARKAYLDAIDYYQVAQKKAPDDAALYNKIGISQLMLQRYRDAGRSFEEAIKKDHRFSDAYNNLGVVQYERRKYRAAIKQYKKAMEIAPDMASFYSNLGAAYFAKKKFEDASRSYARALELDPSIFEHSSRTGITAQMASPEDRAHYDYVLARLYAKINDPEHSLQYLRKAIEDGYKSVKNVYTDPEFANLRKDARFEELMKEHTVALSE
ncbi:MAG TPA: tetratricopeptide repeat protein [Terriglobales bacterium]|jgi:tetratricopeptide (TPR) repeat protein|nr:tetratricopeptide repeat protein [Terriglobales bacterium]